ncbi:hypothetical protein PLESTM_001638000 [Pleodorina starrii]|nr:hypothetical protein PLESTM_001638000 [Pleodorina starrii]
MSSGPVFISSPAAAAMDPAQPRCGGRAAPFVRPHLSMPRIADAVFQQLLLWAHFAAWMATSPREAPRDVRVSVCVRTRADPAARRRPGVAGALLLPLFSCGVCGAISGLAAGF